MNFASPQSFHNQTIPVITPAAGLVKVYAENNKLYQKNSDGVSKELIGLVNNTPSNGQVLAFNSATDLIEFQTTAASSSTIYEGVIDFGDNLLRQNQIAVTITNPQVLVTSRVQLGSIIAGSGRDPDEVEMETLVSSLGEIRTGEFDIYTNCLTGGATNKYIIQYTIT